MYIDRKQEKTRHRRPAACLRIGGRPSENNFKNYPQNLCVNKIWCNFASAKEDRVCVDAVRPSFRRE